MTFTVNGSFVTITDTKNVVSEYLDMFDVLSIPNYIVTTNLGQRSTVGRPGP